MNIGSVSWGTTTAASVGLLRTVGKCGIASQMWASKGIVETRWLNHVLVQGAWALDQDRTARVYLSTAGWTKIVAGSDSIFFNLLSQLLAAKAAGWLVNVSVDQGGITQIKMPDSQPSTPPVPPVRPPDMAGITWQVNAQVTALGSINQDRNVWMYIQGIGWVRQSTASESGWAALNMLASSALSTKKLLNYRWDQQGSDVWGVQLVAREIYLLYPFLAAAARKGERGGYMAYEGYDPHSAQTSLWLAMLVD